MHHTFYQVLYWETSFIHFEMRGYPLMGDSQSHSRDFQVFLGMLLFVYVVYALYTGKLPGRFGAAAYRAENPKRYWCGLTLYFLVGLALYLI